MRAIAALSLLFLFGCATVVERERPLPLSVAGTSLDTTALVESLLSRSGTTVQALDGAWKDRTFQAQCVMKGENGRLTVVFLAPQLRLVTIELERPHRIRCERAPQIPAAFEPEFVLADLAYVNLDVESLRRAVAPALKVEEKDGLRRITTAAGELVAEVRRAENGEVNFRNAVHGYEYRIRDIGGQ